MCGTCGCGDSTVTLTDTATGETAALRDPHHHHHGRAGDTHTHADGTTHSHGPAETISLERAVLDRNDRIAARNRGFFEGRGLLALNLVSSPGSGKTTLLERTIRDLGAARDIAVIEGDQMTTVDANRIRAAGGRAIQINTGAGCHLEADMIAGAVSRLDLRAGSLLLIENVGNLVCPAMFDLGERMKVAVISVTEGEDKPLKYPFMFRAAEAVIVNKTDLAAATGFDREACLANIRAINPSARILLLSARTGEGLESWYALLASLQDATH